MGLLFLLFLCGFAAATLIFWPLLNRASKRAEESRAPQRGKHALAAATASAPAGADTTAAEPEQSGSGGGESEETGGESTQPVKVEAPQPRIHDDFEMPELPTDLFKTRYESKFNRPKRRLERIRADLGQAE